MKIVLIFDQGLAGQGGKGNLKLPLTIQKGGVGSALMLEPHFKKHNIEILATLSCGIETYQENQEEVVTKMCAMVKKLAPDFVLAGPCFNFDVYAEMSAKIVKVLKDKNIVPACTMMAIENNKTINEYASQIDIIKMPKKGGTGLNDSFSDLCEYIDCLFNNQAHLKEIKERICY